ncbi:uncharacterized protein MONBRDRAFT_11178 [Monosiga brevicollis MX1]|uniref:Uncharacterized protein n=1 Tax=Monosiga brevicollis TaxID=81824 RepID=A9V8F4_MONBE|nr:uncharacterized protein MONBRDRAFT_11178 [Monosiga brevicollis MX1]EDQ86135.1 predicted protein [Monosiga brevicollis MX1]|eukprot:XP_001749060.1 hypothetical protein [Monosiga brevicollis MX1]
MSDDGEQLYDACYSSDPQEALQLLTSWNHQRLRDAAQYKGGFFRDTPLHWACYNGHVKVLEMLLKHGADTEAKNNVSTVPPSSPLYPPYDGAPVPHDDDDAVPYGNTPLHYACLNGQVKVVEMLLKHGADAIAKTGVSTSSSLFSPSSPYDGAPVPHNDDDGDGDAVPDGYTPLHWACRYGHDKVVEMLLKHGVYVEAKNNKIKSMTRAGFAERLKQNSPTTTEKERKTALPSFAMTSTDDYGVSILAAAVLRELVMWAARRRVHQKSTQITLHGKSLVRYREDDGHFHSPVEGCHYRHERSGTLKSHLRHLHEKKMPSTDAINSIAGSD